MKYADIQNYMRMIFITRVAVGVSDVGINVMDDEDSPVATGEMLKMVLVASCLPCAWRGRRYRNVMGNASGTIFNSIPS
ncbi:hypothetical protein AAFN90_01200 [Erwiniaceae bacterium CAU 1747]